MFDSAVEGLWIMDTDGKVSFYNHTFYQQFELDLEASHFSDWLALIHPLDKNIFLNRVNKNNDDDQPNERISSQYRVRKKGGSYCWIEATEVLKSDASGDYMVGNHRDISEKRMLESYIHQLAYFDKSSGLPNNDKLKQDISDTTCNCILVHIQLDKIKSYINQYGEELIAEMLDRIISCMNAFQSHKSDFYRNSPDTFSVLVRSLITEQDLALMCQKFVGDFRSMSRADGKLFAGEVYVGAYPCTKKIKSADEVISWAAQTCEYAQRHEPAHWAICNSRVKKKVERFFYIENQIKSAIESDEISIRVQPIVSAQSYRPISFEALARWEGGEIGEIYPDEFIPVAERKGFIESLGETVLIQACKFIAAYNSKWNSKVRMNVNVSVLQLLDGNFPQRASRIVLDCGVAASDIMLELTESVLLDDKHQAMSQIRQLKAFGFNLAMDDFGSGHSSLTGFFRLPFKQLKIDKEFAVEVIKEKEAFVYIKFLSEMNQERDVFITVEGIETKAMLAIFNKVNVNSYQGYLFARPMKSADALMLDAKKSLLNMSNVDSGNY